MEQGISVKPWHGMSREAIVWHPTVDEKKCIGCGMCVTGCGRKVYGFDYEKKKPVVLRPVSCMVACVTCANTCLQDAIGFPPVEQVRELIRKGKLLAKAKEELNARKEELKAAFNMIDTILQASKSDARLAALLDEARECARVYLLAQKTYKGFEGMGEVVTLKEEFKDAVNEMIRYCREKNYLSGAFTFDTDSMAKTLGGGAVF